MTNTIHTPISTQIVRTKNKKKKSLKKDKLFNLLSMETLLEYVPYIKSKYEHLVRTSASLFGYHWNEVINTILYNKYVKNNPDVFRLYISIKNIVDTEKNRDKANKANSSLKEIMDPTKDYGFKEKDFDKKIFDIDEEVISIDYNKDGYSINFDYIKNKNILYVVFKYNDNMDLINKNEQFKIFKYVSDLLNNFIKNNEVNKIIYRVDDEKEGIKRNNIYGYVLNKMGFTLIDKINKGYIIEYVYQKEEDTFLKEILDPTKDYNSITDDIIKQYNYNNTKDSRGTIEKEIVIDNYQIKLKINENTLVFKFYYNDSTKSTNKNEQYKVFKFISDILNYTIQKESITKISYQANDRKHNIYKKVLEKLGFNLVTGLSGMGDNYFYKKEESSSLKEILDPTKDYGFKETDFDKKNREVDDYTINTTYKKDNYNIFFNYEPKLKNLKIDFSYAGKFSLSNKSEYFKIFKYISDLLNNFMKNNEVISINYESDEKRHNIYKHVLNKLNFVLKLKFNSPKGDVQYIYMKETPTELTETTTTGSVFGGSGFPIMRGVFNMSKGQNMFDPKNKIVDKIKNKQINKDMSIVNFNKKQLQEKYLKNIDITNVGEVNNFLNENNFTIDEHHIESRKGKINFILCNSDDYTETDLTYFSDDQITKIYNKVENGKFDNNKSDMDKQILDAETLMNEVEAMFMNEEAKHPFTKNIDKINKENSKNSKTYFKELNKGVQDMINRKSDSTESIYFKNDYDKDSKKLNILTKAIDNTDNNKEYLEVVHRGLEDLEPTYPNKKWEENSKKYMGDKLYNQGKKRREEKLRLNQPNTSPGRMNTNLPKPKINEASDLITFYYNNFNKKEFITESKDNIRQNKFIDKTNFIKLELVTPINESKAINFNNEYYYNIETGKIYYELNKKPLTILKENSNKFNQLINLDNTSKYNSKKTINKKIK
jgi:hypothetical protein